MSEAPRYHRTCSSTARTSTPPWAPRSSAGAPPRGAAAVGAPAPVRPGAVGPAGPGLFFLAANTELPMTFVQALLAIGYRPVPLSGGPGEKVVDIAIQRTSSSSATARPTSARQQRRRLRRAGRRPARRPAGRGRSASSSSATARSSRWPSAGWSRSTSSTTCRRSTSGCRACGSSRSTSSTRPSSSDRRCPRAQGRGAGSEANRLSPSRSARYLVTS